MKWIIDADPGIDDAAAIIACLRLGLDVLGINVVHGNSPVEDTLRNALRLKDLLQSEVPIYKGCGRAILEPQLNATEVHGKDGLGDVDWPSLVSEPEEKHAVDMLIEQSYIHSGNLGILAVGPLTNIALALIKDETLSERVNELVIMGGTSGARGNTTIVGEFNFAADPEAAAVVLQSGIPITLVPWETCYHNLVTLEQLEQGGKEALRNLVGEKFLEITAALFERTRHNLGYSGLLLCDLIAAAVILDPEVVTEDLDVFAAVETSGVYGRGLTAIDYAGVTGNEPNVRLILQVDRERLGALLRRALIV